MIGSSKSDFGSWRCLIDSPGSQIELAWHLLYLLVELAEGSPFYMAAVMRSEFEGKDLTTNDGLTGVLEFETLDNRGTIKSTWMEYITSAFQQINDRHAKRIVLHLSKYKDREWTRQELLDELELDMTDGQLEKKLKALVKADIINQGKSNFDYRGVGDNIFNKVFRGVYEKEIREFDRGVINKEYSDALKVMKKRYHVLQGRYNYQRGYFAEYLILEQLRLHARVNSRILKEVTRNLPEDFDFCEYSRVWRYESSPEYVRRLSVDIFARAAASGDYSIIGEVKSRDNRKFSKEEVMAFENKMSTLKVQENIECVLGFIFSRSGFTQEAEKYCKERDIACSESERWLTW